MQEGRDSSGRFAKGTNFWVGRKHSEESKRKMRLARLGRFKGPNHPMWKGGVAMHRRTLTTPGVKEWRTAVFERDGYKCVWCGISGSKATLQADHILPWAYFPEKRFDLDNGRTLCVPCHEKTDTYKGRATSKYKNLLITKTLTCK